MIMSKVFTGILAISVIAAVYYGNGAALASAAVEGAQAGVTLALSLAGSVCLWTGVGHLMEKTGLSEKLSAFLRPLLGRIFPETKKDPLLAGALSTNICANFLGMGNAATPLGIRAAKRLAVHGQPGIAGDGLCRLVVLNTASIQLIPATVAALRVSCGCTTPFDILPGVWLTSFCSAGVGLLAAWLLGRVWRNA